jgi:hypothetical protein
MLACSFHPHLNRHNPLSTFVRTMTEEETVKIEKKAPPANLVIPPKKPKLGKAERRALQEQQRAEKANRGQPPQGGADNHHKKTPVAAVAASEPTPKSDVSSTALKTPNKAASKAEETKVVEKTMDDKAIDLFSHLPPYQGKCVLWN